MPASHRFSRLALATLLCLASVPCVWVLQNFVGEHFGATALLTYLPPHGFTLLPLALGLAALRKRCASLVCLNVLTLLLWGKWLLGFNLPFRLLAPEKTTPTVRLVSYSA